MKILPTLSFWVVAFGMFGTLAVADDIVLDWNKALITAVQKESTPPGLVARNLAIMHIAIHDAVNAVDPHFSLIVEKDGKLKGSAKAAAMAAAYHTASHLYPGEGPSFEKLFTEQRSEISDGVGEKGFLAGQTIAVRVLESRKDDGASRSIHYIPKEALGQWRRTTRNRPPELPHWRTVKPFQLKRPDQFRPPAPPTLDSPAYAEELNLVRQIGSKDSLERSEEETLIARFWADFTYTSSPPGHWNEIAREVISSSVMNLHEQARAFAILNIALADAGIAAFDCKYHHNYWRPITAIHQADKDSNPHTAADSTWAPLLPTPTHPEYVSAHSAFSGAAAEVLAHLLGSDEVEFSITSIDAPGVVRNYRSFKACAKEIGRSRILGGIHFPSANKQGLKLGRKVGQSTIHSFVTSESTP